MISTNTNEFLWVTKYRPQTVAETILPTTLKKTFQTFVDQKNIPNLLLNGGAGIGKTTVAKAMCNELDCDVLTINASLNGNVDTLRNEISQFASTMSFKSGRKIVFLDEADNLTQATQAGLRAFMEEFASNCGFILTCNFKNRIIEPLHSRLSVIDFSIPKEEQPKLAMEFFKRMEEILTAEGVGYDKDAVVALIKQHFPDWRRVIGELQRYSATGHINTGVLATIKDKDFDELVGLLKNKKWNEMRKWVGEHTDVEPNALLRHFYDQSKAVIKPASIPTLVLLLAETQYRLQFSADHEICIAAFLTQTMSEISFQ